MIRSMKSAPKDKAIIIFTSKDAHQAKWDDDPRFMNFWSDTANRALSKSEALGWLHKLDWRLLVRSEQK